MKKDIIEELRRIYEITYKNESLISEGFIDDLLNKSKEKLGLNKTDVPNKADYVNPDVQEFYKTLEDAAKSGGLNQSKLGSMTFQKGVEALQIALTILGFDLPKHGIDGLFGPETAAAVNQFSQSMINETVESLRSTIGSLGYEEKGNELTSGGNISNGITDIVSRILTDFKKTDPHTSVIITAGNDSFHKGIGYASSHSMGNSIDLTLNPYSRRGARKFKSVLDSYTRTNSDFTYIDEYSTPSRHSTGGHFHLQYGGEPSQSGPSDKPQLTPQTLQSTVSATPNIIMKLINLLKSRQINSSQITPYVDPIENNSSVADLDINTNEGYAKYGEICDRFLSGYSNPLRISGEMLAYAAKIAQNRYGNYVPPELALSQLVIEGGIGNTDLNSRPIRTRNPFNVGNTDSGRDNSFNSVQSSINAYYKLIASKYINKGKTGKDLLRSFVNKHGNRYASDENYESKLSSVAQKVNQIARSVMA